MNSELFSKFKRLATLAETLLIIADNLTDSTIALSDDEKHQQEYKQLFKEIFAEVSKKPIDTLNVDDMAEELLLKAVFDCPHVEGFREFFLKRSLESLGFKSRLNLSFFTASPESIYNEFPREKSDGCRIM